MHFAGHLQNLERNHFILKVCSNQSCKSFMANNFSTQNLSINNWLQKQPQNTSANTIFHPSLRGMSCISSPLITYFLWKWHKICQGYFFYIGFLYDLFTVIKTSRKDCLTKLDRKFEFLLTFSSTDFHQFPKSILPSVEGIKRIMNLINTKWSL